MKYSIKELSQLAGVSARTLRYYDQINLLKPLYVNEAGYRFYGEKEIDLLQQILFYRERGFELKQIQEIIYREEFDVIGALQEHLLALEKQREHMNALIRTVEQTILSMKGEYEMSSKEKFDAFKEKAVKENEDKYGAEAREKYGDKAVEESNKNFLGMSEEEWKKFRCLESQIKKCLRDSVGQKMTPESEEAKRIVKLHKEWLCMTCKEYSADYHKGIASMYISDERFTAYYDEEVPGCAKLLEGAVKFWADRLERD